MHLHFAEQSSEHSTMSPPFLEARNLSVLLDKTLILNNLNFTLYLDEIVMLIGPNGGGKSTLVRTLLQLAPFSSGSVTHHFKHLRVGYVPQRHWTNLEINLSAERFLRLHPQAMRPSLFESALELSEFPLALGHCALAKLSGGERQRLLLARALLNEPQWLVLDEPTASLDPEGQKKFYERLSDIRARFNCAILFVSHDVHRVLAKADRIFCLDKSFQCSGKPLHGSCKNCRRYGSDLDPNLSCYRHAKHLH